ncbi:MAG: DNA recombination protein RmuC [Gammaproteobacteria bacterium]|nr:DNA recombination protein RmuC [Gammaproteobacteria bacterium]MDH5652110.1 DNA recombination protein RmuC [Gammaproteobacteria bacterium]
MSEPLIYSLIALVAALLGGLLTYLRLQQKLAALREQQVSLQTTLDLERKAGAEKIAALNQAREQLSETFSHLSSQALKHNSEEFLKLAGENLKQFQVQASGDLQQKEKAIENLVKPIKEALEKTEKQIQSIESERKEAYGSLHAHLQNMARMQENLQGETRNLVQALRRPEVRGQWGELTLKRLAELAGMVEHCDFYEQENITTQEGRMRPDMIVRMPDRREIIVDVKTPLDAYLNAIEADDDEQQQQELQRHARNVRRRVDELAGKDYWKQFPDAPEFVVLFIPGDQFLSAALNEDRDLLEDALRKQVILATPTSFVALLRAVAFGWRQEQLAHNAEHIRQTGEELYSRLMTFTDHLTKLGKSLDGSIRHYNNAVGSFDSRVLPGARKFKEMGISTGKETARPERIETASRQPDTLQLELEEH